MNIDEQVLNLKSSVFGGSDDIVKSFSVRLPLELTAHVDAITDVSGKSRNVIVIELLKIGVAYFIDNLNAGGRSEIGEAYDKVKRDLMIEMMENK